MGKKEQGIVILINTTPPLSLLKRGGRGSLKSEQGMKDDKQLEGYLKRGGIKVIRFNNLDILKNMAGVFECIQKELPPTPSL